MFDDNQVHQKHDPKKVWHIRIQNGRDGHFEELLADLELAVATIKNGLINQVKEVDWSKKEEVTICLKWVGKSMQTLAEILIEELPVKIKFQITGRVECQGHDIQT